MPVADGVVRARQAQAGPDAALLQLLRELGHRGPRVRHTDRRAQPRRHQGDRLSRVDCRGAVTQNVIRASEGLLPLPGRAADDGESADRRLQLLVHSRPENRRDGVERSAQSQVAYPDDQGERGRAVAL